MAFSSFVLLHIRWNLKLINLHWQMLQMLTLLISLYTSQGQCPLKKITFFCPFSPQYPHRTKLLLWDQILVRYLTMHALKSLQFSGRTNTVMNTGLFPGITVSLEVSWAMLGADLKVPNHQWFWWSPVSQ